MAKAPLVVLSLALPLAACSRAAPQGGFVARAAPGVTVIHGDAAHAAGLEGQRVQLPVAGEGPAMLAGFLRTVHAHGATFVSDIEVHVVDAQDGAWQECVTRLEPIDHGRAKVEKTTQPGQWVIADGWRIVGNGPSQRVARCTDAPANDPNGGGGSCVIEYQGGGAHVQSAQAWVWQPPQTRLERTWVSDWRLDSMAPACKPLAAPPVAAPARSIQATVYGSL